MAQNIAQLDECSEYSKIICILLSLCRMFYIHVVFSWLIQVFRFSISLLIFHCFLFLTKREVLKFSTIIMDFSISPFSSTSFCFMNFKVLFLSDHRDFILK